MLLSAAQLHDQLCKSKKKATHTGKLGGRYYISDTGKKVYTGEPPVERTVVVDRETGKKIHTGDLPAGEVDSPTLRHFISTPHTSGDTQSKVQAKVEVTKRAAEKEDLSLRFRPKAKITSSSMASAKVAQRYWRAYRCRSCGAFILPTFADRTKWNRVLGVEYHPLHGWVVNTEEEEGYHDSYPVSSRDEGLALAEDLKEYFHAQGPWQVAGEVLEVHKTKIEGQHKHVELLEPGEPPPDAVARKVCDDCYRHYEVVSRTTDPGRTKIKSTPESRAAARERRKKERSLMMALKKDPKKRTPEERQMVSEHEAIEATRQREAKEREKEEKRTGKRREYEEAMFARQEQAALEKLRHQYKEKLIREKHMDPADAAEQAAKMTEEEAREFQLEQLKAASKRREETIKQLQEEHGGERVESYFDPGTLQAHVERRRHGLKGGEKHGGYRETLRPAEAAMAERARTAKLRERQKEAKKKGKGKKQTKKSLWVSL